MTWLPFAQHNIRDHLEILRWCLLSGLLVSLAGVTVRKSIKAFFSSKASARLVEGRVLFLWETVYFLINTKLLISTFQRIEYSLAAIQFLKMQCFTAWMLKISTRLRNYDASTIQKRKARAFRPQKLYSKEQPNVTLSFKFRRLHLGFESHCR